MYAIDYEDLGTPDPAQSAGPVTLKDEEIEKLKAERNEARERKDFAKADEIRAKLASFGITLEDRPDGTTRWKR